LAIKVLRQGYFIDLGLILEIFRENYLVDRGTIVRFLLQALLDDHIEVFGDTLWDGLVLLFLHLFFELFDVGCVVGVLLRAHLVKYDSKSPNIRCLALLLVLPKLRCQVVWSANSLDFLLLLSLGCAFIGRLDFQFLADALQAVSSLRSKNIRLILDLLYVTKVTQFG
jgi:hypothetical protein